MAKHRSNERCRVLHAPTMDQNAWHDGVLVVELVGVHGVAPPVRHVDLYASRAPHAPTLLALQHLRQLLLREDAEQLLRNHLEQPVQQER